MISAPHRKVRFHGETVRNALGIRTHPPQQEKVSSTNATCWVAPFSVITTAGGMISIPSWRSYARKTYRAQFRKDIEKAYLRRAMNSSKR